VSKGLGGPEVNDNHYLREPLTDNLTLFFFFWVGSPQILLLQNIENFCLPERIAIALLVGWLAKSVADATTAIFKCAASMHFRLGGSGRVTLGRAH